MNKKHPRDLILQTLREKSAMKQDVFAVTFEALNGFKSAMKDTVDYLYKEMVNADKRIAIEYRSKSEFSAEMKIAGDTLIFQMHTNVFHFDKSHNLWNTSYVKEDPYRAYCGMINIYNFLSDSLKYNRENDLGYLIGRIFINKDKHFFVEGKRQLGFLYNNFANSVMDEKMIPAIVESSVLYCLDFDLLTPSYDTMKEVSVHEIQELSKMMVVTTGKRLGFKFQADTDSIQ